MNFISNVSVTFLMASSLMLASSCGKDKNTNTTKTEKDQDNKELLINHYSKDENTLNTVNNQLNNKNNKQIEEENKRKQEEEKKRKQEEEKEEENRRQKKLAEENRLKQEEENRLKQEEIQKKQIAAQKRQQELQVGKVSIEQKDSFLSISDNGEIQVVKKPVELSVTGPGLLKLLKENDLSRQELETLWDMVDKSYDRLTPNLVASTLDDIESFLFKSKNKNKPREEKKIELVSAIKRKLRGLDSATNLLLISKRLRDLGASTSADIFYIQGKQKAYNVFLYDLAKKPLTEAELTTRQNKKLSVNDFASIYIKSIGDNPFFTLTYEQIEALNNSNEEDFVQKIKEIYSDWSNAKKLAFKDFLDLMFNINLNTATTKMNAVKLSEVFGPHMITMTDNESVDENNKLMQKLLTSFFNNKLVL
jgi:hypothetical protein